MEHINALYNEQSNRIPMGYVWRYAHQSSTFTEYLHALFPSDEVRKAVDLYQIGGLDDGRTIFWQIDFMCQCRSGKIIDYGMDGHRRKDGHFKGATWCHYYLRRDDKIPHDFTLEQCMFGEHLLHIYPDKPVALVEAEKTAIICSIIFPGYNWLAVGGMSNFNSERCKALALRDVVVFPDTDMDGSTYKKWKGTASAMRFMCKSIAVSSILEKCATYEEKTRKIDIADYILKNYTGEHWTDNPPYKRTNDKIMQYLESL